MVRDVVSVVDVPVAGMGGIMNWQDAIEFVMVSNSHSGWNCKFYQSKSLC